MSEARKPTEPRGSRDVAIAAARWMLAGVFVVLGLSKALQPVEFLKLIREYGLFEHAVTLNVVAATLPWIEVACGLLLIAGVAVRGTAALLGALLVGFTTAIMVRATGIQGATGAAFCAIKFDCGCGGGEVFVCRKILENAALLVLCVVQIFARRQRFCWRHSLLRSRLRE